MPIVSTGIICLHGSCIKRCVKDVLKRHPFSKTRYFALGKGHTLEQETFRQQTIRDAV